jgi:hypothetical protein
MTKVTKTGPKKEKSAEKRRRRENNKLAREQARRFVVPTVVLLFVLLAGFLFYKFGTGKEWNSETRERRRQRLLLSKIMRDSSGDYSKMQEMMKQAGLYQGSQDPINLDLSGQDLSGADIQSSDVSGDSVDAVADAAKAENENDDDVLVE